MSTPSACMHSSQGAPLPQPPRQPPPPQHPHRRHPSLQQHQGPHPAAAPRATAGTQRHVGIFWMVSAPPGTSACFIVLFLVCTLSKSCKAHPNLARRCTRGDVAWRHTSFQGWLHPTAMPHQCTRIHPSSSGQHVTAYRPRIHRATAACECTHALHTHVHACPRLRQPVAPVPRLLSCASSIAKSDCPHTQCGRIGGAHPRPHPGAKSWHTHACAISCVCLSARASSCASTHLDAGREALGVLWYEAALQQGGIKEQVAQFSGGLLRLVRLRHALLQAADQGVPAVASLSVGIKGPPSVV